MPDHPPLAQGEMLRHFTVAVFVVVQTVTDLAHAAVDPRIRLDAR